MTRAPNAYIAADEEQRFSLSFILARLDRSHDNILSSRALPVIPDILHATLCITKYIKCPIVYTFHTIVHEATDLTQLEITHHSGLISRSEVSHRRTKHESQQNRDYGI